MKKWFTTYIKTYIKMWIFAFGLLTYIMLIIVFPTLELDILIAVNLLFAFTILIAALSIKRTSFYSLLPKLLLLSIFSSMVVSVITARSILIRGAEFDGWLIRFVSLLFASSRGIVHLIISFTIFIVIIAICTNVITKGAVRVAEVATRFTLDTMQAKLMAIEVLYNSGEINEEEADSRKAALQKEDDFLSSLNGIRKYFFCNVEVNIYIISFISIGGTLIDTLYRGISVNNAILTFFSLAVGSGIIFMLPPFLLSMAVRRIVTKLRNNWTLASPDRPICYM